MLISINKQEDIKFRSDILDIMLVCLRMYAKTSNEKYLEHSRYFGKLSQEVKIRVNTFDYSKLDERRKKIDIIINQTLDETTKQPVPKRNSFNQEEVRV